MCEALPKDQRVSTTHPKLTLLLTTVLPREKRKARTQFDLLRSVHSPEFSTLRTPPQPKHKLEVTIESSVFTQEKYVTGNLGI